MHHMLGIWQVRERDRSQDKLHPVMIFQVLVSHTLLCCPFPFTKAYSQHLYMWTQLLACNDIPV